MEIFRQLAKPWEPIRLDADNPRLHEELQNAVKENRTLRLTCKVEKGCTVQYLRERTLGEFCRENMDHLFGSGKLAAAAKQNAWEAVNQALNGIIDSMHTVPSPRSAASKMQRRNADHVVLSDELSEERMLRKQALSSARATATAVYPHIMGVKPDDGSFAIVSSRLSIRLCATQSDGKAKRWSNGKAQSSSVETDPVAIAMDSKSSEESPAKYLKTVYRRDALEGATSTTRTGHAVHIRFRYQADEARLYGYDAGYWQEAHTKALDQAVRELSKEGKLNAPVAIDVDNVHTFRALREALESAEFESSWELYRNAAQTSDESPPYTTA